MKYSREVSPREIRFFFNFKQTQHVTECRRPVTQQAIIIQHEVLLERVARCDKHNNTSRLAAAARHTPSPTATSNPMQTVFVLLKRTSRNLSSLINKMSSLSEFQ